MVLPHLVGKIRQYLFVIEYGTIVFVILVGECFANVEQENPFHCIHLVCPGHCQAQTCPVIYMCELSLIQ